MSSESFKETELGLIPQNWYVANLGEFTEIFTGFPFKSALFSEIGIPAS